MRHPLVPTLFTTSALLVGCTDAIEDPATADVVTIAPTDDPALSSSCLVTKQLPCAVAIGETYGAFTVRTADDAEDAVEAVLAHVFGTARDVHALAAPLTRSADAYARDEATLATSSFAWTYAGELGTAAAPAFLTVKADRGFAIFPVFGMSAGTAQLADAAITHARFWRTTSSQCRAITPTAIHGTAAAGNSRLARIEDGRVPCLHADDGTVTTCAFTAASGTWVAAADGDYALVGQPIDLDGHAAGEYVVAARVARDGAVPCLAPQRWRDSAGTSSTMELASACVVETLLASTNVTGMPLVNHATREVCSSDVIHPDGAGRTGQLSATSYCYTGRGAALNDLNGTERDEYGNYYTETERCHVAWISGVEGIAAKRPATKSFPAPGTIRTDTPIVWRSYVKTIAIAN